MTHEHPNPNLHDDPSSSPLILGSILGIVLTLVSIIASAAIYYQYESKLTKEFVANPQAQTVQRLHADQQTQLTAAPGWADKERQIVTVPIDLAMKLVVREYEGGKSPPPFVPPASAPAPK